MILLGIIASVPPSGGGDPINTGDPHRYWRVQSLANSGDLNDTGAAHIGLFEYTDGEADLIVGANSDQITVFDEADNLGNELENAINNLKDETWQGSDDGDEQFFSIDFGVGNQVRIGKVLISAGDSEAQHTIKDFELQWSDDGVTWNEEFTVSGESNFTFGETRTYSSPAGSVQDVAMVNSFHVHLPMGRAADGVVVNEMRVYVPVGSLSPNGNQVGIYGMSSHVVLEP